MATEKTESELFQPTFPLKKPQIAPLKTNKKAPHPLQKQISAVTWLHWTMTVTCLKLIHEH